MNDTTTPPLLPSLASQILTPLLPPTSTTPNQETANAILQNFEFAASVLGRRGGVFDETKMEVRKMILCDPDMGERKRRRKGANRSKKLHEKKEEDAADDDENDSDSDDANEQVFGRFSMLSDRVLKLTVDDYPNLEDDEDFPKEDDVYPEEIDIAIEKVKRKVAIAASSPPPSVAATTTGLPMLVRRSSQEQLFEDSSLFPLVSSSPPPMSIVLQGRGGLGGGSGYNSPFLLPSPTPSSPSIPPLRERRRRVTKLWSADFNTPPGTPPMLPQKSFVLDEGLGGGNNSSRIESPTNQRVAALMNKKSFRKQQGMKSPYETSISGGIRIHAEDSGGSDNNSLGGNERPTSRESRGSGGGGGDDNNFENRSPTPPFGAARPRSRQATLRDQFGGSANASEKNDDVDTLDDRDSGILIASRPGSRHQQERIMKNMDSNGSGTTNSMAFGRGDAGMKNFTFMENEEFIEEQETEYNVLNRSPGSSSASLPRVDTGEFKVAGLGNALDSPMSQGGNSPNIVNDAFGMAVSPQNNQRTRNRSSPYRRRNASVLSVGGDYGGKGYVETAEYASGGSSPEPYLIVDNSPQPLLPSQQQQQQQQSRTLSFAVAASSSGLGGVGGGGATTASHGTSSSFSPPPPGIVALHSYLQACLYIRDRAGKNVRAGKLRVSLALYQRAAREADEGITLAQEMIAEEDEAEEGEEGENDNGDNDAKSADSPQHYARYQFPGGDGASGGGNSPTGSIFGRKGPDLLLPDIFDGGNHSFRRDSMASAQSLELAVGGGVMGGASPLLLQAHRRVSMAFRSGVSHQPQQLQLQQPYSQQQQPQQQQRNSYFRPIPLRTLLAQLEEQLILAVRGCSTVNMQLNRYPEALRDCEVLDLFEKPYLNEKTAERWMLAMAYVYRPEEEIRQIAYKVEKPSWISAIALSDVDGNLERLPINVILPPQVITVIKDGTHINWTRQIHQSVRIRYSGDPLRGYVLEVDKEGETIKKGSIIVSCGRAIQPLGIVPPAVDAKKAVKKIADGEGGGGNGCSTSVYTLEDETATDRAGDFGLVNTSFTTASLLPAALFIMKLAKHSRVFRVRLSCLCPIRDPRMRVEIPIELFSTDDPPDEILEFVEFHNQNCNLSIGAILEMLRQSPFHGLEDIAIMARNVDALWFAMHSCAPNAILKKKRYIVATRDIAPGELVSSDYVRGVDSNLLLTRCANILYDNININDNNSSSRPRRTRFIIKHTRHFECCCEDCLQFLSSTEARKLRGDYLSFVLKFVRRKHQQQQQKQQQQQANNRPKLMLVKKSEEERWDSSSSDDENVEANRLSSSALAAFLDSPVGRKAVPNQVQQLSSPSNSSSTASRLRGGRLLGNRLRQAILQSTVTHEKYSSGIISKEQREKLDKEERERQEQVAKAEEERNAIIVNSLLPSVMQCIEIIVNALLARGIGMFVNSGIGEESSSNKSSREEQEVNAAAPPAARRKFGLKRQISSSSSSSSSSTTTTTTSSSPMTCSCLFHAVAADESGKTAQLIAEKVEKGQIKLPLPACKCVMCRDSQTLSSCSCVVWRVVFTLGCSFLPQYLLNFLKTTTGPLIRFPLGNGSNTNMFDVSLSTTELKQTLIELCRWRIGSLAPSTILDPASAVIHSAQILYRLTSPVAQLVPLLTLMEKMEKDIIQGVIRPPSDAGQLVRTLFFEQGSDASFFSMEDKNNFVEALYFGLLHMSRIADATAVVSGLMQTPLLLTGILRRYERNREMLHLATSMDQIYSQLARLIATSRMIREYEPSKFRFEPSRSIDALFSELLPRTWPILKSEVDGKEEKQSKQQFAHQDRPWNLLPPHCHIALDCFEIRRTRQGEEGVGFGLFATRDIPAGTLLFLVDPDLAIDVGSFGCDSGSGDADALESFWNSTTPKDEEVQDDEQAAAAAAVQLPQEHPNMMHSPANILLLTPTNKNNAKPKNMEALLLNSGSEDGQRKKKKLDPFQRSPVFEKALRLAARHVLATPPPISTASPTTGRSDLFSFFEDKGEQQGTSPCIGGLANSWIRRAGLRRMSTLQPLRCDRDQRSIAGREYIQSKIEAEKEKARKALEEKIAAEEAEKAAKEEAKAAAAAGGNGKKKKDKGKGTSAAAKAKKNAPNVSSLTSPWTAAFGSDPASGGTNNNNSNLINTGSNNNNNNLSGNSGGSIVVISTGKLFPELAKGRPISRDKNNGSGDAPPKTQDELDNSHKTGPDEWMTQDEEDAFLELIHPFKYLVHKDSVFNSIPLSIFSFDLLDDFGTRRQQTDLPFSGDWRIRGSMDVQTMYQVLSRNYTRLLFFDSPPSPQFRRPKCVALYSLPSLLNHSCAKPASVSLLFISSSASVAAISNVDIKCGEALTRNYKEDWIDSGRGGYKQSQVDKDEIVGGATLWIEEIERQQRKKERERGVLYLLKLEEKNRQRKFRQDQRRAGVLGVDDETESDSSDEEEVVIGGKQVKRKRIKRKLKFDLGFDCKCKACHQAAIAAAARR